MQLIYADDPYRSYRFSIEVDGITDAYFTEVSRDGIVL